MSKQKDWSQLNRKQKDWESIEIEIPEKFKEMTLNQLLDYGDELKGNLDVDDNDSALDYTTALEGTLLNLARSLIRAKCSIMSAYSFLDSYAQEEALVEQSNGMFINKSVN